RGGANRHAHLVGDHIGQRRLPKTWRAVEQDVIERFATAAGGGNGDVQILPEPVLADVLVEGPRPQSRFVLRVIVRRARGDEPIGHRPASLSSSAHSAWPRTMCIS